MLSCSGRAFFYACLNLTIRRGVRRGCVLSPRLFHFYTEMIIREADTEELGVTINGRKVTNIMFADDNVLIAEGEVNLQIMLDRV